MKFLFAAITILCGPSAFAASSACVIFAQNNGDGATIQQSCDGAELTDLFSATGITVGLSKAIPYFVDKGYTQTGCTDSYDEGTNGAPGTAYSRCVFIKK